MQTTYTDDSLATGGTGEGTHADDAETVGTKARRTKGRKDRSVKKNKKHGLAATPPKPEATPEATLLNGADGTALAVPGDAPAPVEGAPRQPVPQTAAGMLGSVAWLMMHSPAHKHLFLTDLEWLVLPPVLLQQFRVFRRNNVPFAYVSWGYLSEDVEKRLTNGERKLGPADWKSGDRVWLIDLIAPFGGLDEVVKQLRETVFPGREFRTLRIEPDGGGVKVEVWKGKDLQAGAEDKRAEV